MTKGVVAMKIGVLGRKRFALGSSGSDRNETFEALQASVRSLFKSVFDPERGRLAVYMKTTRERKGSNGSSLGAYGAFVQLKYL